MKAAPTLDGRVRIDPESELDLLVLRAVIPDATSRGDSLSGNVSGRMNSEVEADWREFVEPDLQRTFDDQLSHVAKTLSGAAAGKPIFIEREQAETWFGALNQARLSLEDKYRFHEPGAPRSGGDYRTARVRSNFYQILQGLLLEFLMQ